MITHKLALGRVLEMIVLNIMLSSLLEYYFPSLSYTILEFFIIWIFGLWLISYVERYKVVSEYTDQLISKLFKNY